MLHFVLMRPMDLTLLPFIGLLLLMIIAALRAGLHPFSFLVVHTRLIYFRSAAKKGNRDSTLSQLVYRDGTCLLTSGPCMVLISHQGACIMCISSVRLWAAGDCACTDITTVLSSANVVVIRLLPVRSPFRSLNLELIFCAGGTC